MPVRNKTIFAVLALMLLTPYLAKADDEAAAWEKFHRSIQAADAQQVEARYKKDHTNPPTKAEVEKVVNSMVTAAMDALDEANQFEKSFPKSPQLGEIRNSLIDTLNVDFGLRGFPIPADRAEDIEVFIKSSLKKTPNDPQLYMVLVRVAQAMPIAKAHDLFVELSSDSVPQPARKMAQDGLVNLERLGLQVDMDFTALDGRHVNLANLRGKVVLVDFWSTTCVPCVREFPGLKQLYEKQQPNGFEIVGISLDSDKAALTRFLGREKVPWPQYFDQAGATNRFAIQYGITAIPVMWLVDKKGVLRQLNAQSDLEKKVEALLKE